MKNIQQNQVIFKKNNKYILVYWNKDLKTIISINNRCRDKEKIMWKFTLNNKVNIFRNLWIIIKKWKVKDMQDRVLIFINIHFKQAKEI